MAEKTAYHVLRLTRAKPKPTDTISSTGRAAHDEYELVGENIEAHSSDNAVRIYAESATKRNVEIAGIFVAVPARSFKPTVVSVSTTTTVKVGLDTG